MLKIKKIYNPFMIFIVFVAIYNPPVFIKPHINSLLCVGFISWLYLFLNFYQMKRWLEKKEVLYFLFCIYLIFFYLASVCVLQGESIRNISFIILWGIAVFPFSIMVAIHCQKNDFSQFDLLNIILIAATVQGLMAMFAFILPTIQSSFLYLLNAYGYDDKILFTIGRRMYGYAGGLLFSTPIVQSFLCMVAIFLAITRKWRYIFFFPLLFFSAIINARTSFIMLFIGTFILFLKFSSSKKNFFRLFFASSLFGVFLIMAFFYIMEKAPQTYDWIMQGLNEIYEVVFEENTTGYFTYLKQEKIYSLPDGMHFFFGTGERVMRGNRFGISSDIGYINDIWLGGMFYTIMLYCFFAFLLISFIRKSKKTLAYSINEYIFLFYAMSLPILNIKGFILSVNDYITIFFLIYMNNLITKNKSKGQFVR